MNADLTLVIDGFNSSVTVVVLAAFAIGMLTPVTQAILHDPNFDPWLGGVIPISTVGALWIPKALPVLGERLTWVLPELTVFSASVVYLLILMLFVKLLGRSQLVGLVFLGVVIAVIWLFGASAAEIKRMLGLMPLITTRETTFPAVTIGLSAAVTGLIIAPAFDLLVAGKRQARLLGLPLMSTRAAAIAIVAGLTVLVSSAQTALPLVGLVACLFARQVPVGDHRSLLLISGLFAAILALIGCWFLGALNSGLSPLR